MTLVDIAAAFNAWREEMEIVLEDLRVRVEISTSSSPSFNSEGKPVPAAVRVTFVEVANPAISVGEDPNRPLVHVTGDKLSKRLQGQSAGDCRDFLLSLLNEFLIARRRARLGLAPQVPVQSP